MGDESPQDTELGPKRDLRKLVGDFRQKAGIFPDDSGGERVANYCAERLEAVLEGGEPIQRGIYLVADTPLSLTALTTEDGGGDKQLLAEAVRESLTDEELERFIQEVSGGED